MSQVGCIVDVDPAPLNECAMPAQETETLMATETPVERAKMRLTQVEQRIAELEPSSRFTAEQLVTLTLPISQNRVSHRSQGSASLSYVEAHDIKNMLIRIFGFGGFDSEVIASEIKGGEWFVNAKSGKDNVKVLATATVRITIHPPARPTAVNFAPVRYAETAASSQTGADEGDTADLDRKSTRLNSSHVEISY